MGFKLFVPRFEPPNPCVQKTVLANTTSESLMAWCANSPTQQWRLTLDARVRVVDSGWMSDSFRSDARNLENKLKRQNR